MERLGPGEVHGNGFPRFPPGLGTAATEQGASGATTVRDGLLGGGVDGEKGAHASSLGAAIEEASAAGGHVSGRAAAGRPRPGVPEGARTGSSGAEAEDKKRERAGPAGFDVLRPPTRLRLAWREEHLRRQQEAAQAEMPEHALQALRTLAEGVNLATMVEVGGRVMALVEPAMLDAARVAVEACQQQLAAARLQVQQEAQESWREAWRQLKSDFKRQQASLREVKRAAHSAAGLSKRADVAVWRARDVATRCEVPEAVVRALDVTVAEAQALRTRALEVRRRCQGLLVGEELAPPSSEVSIGMLRKAVERADMAVQRAVERSVLTREYDLAELQREETADARATRADRFRRREGWLHTDEQATRCEAAVLLQAGARGRLTRAAPWKDS